MDEGAVVRMRVGPFGPDPVAVSFEPSGMTYEVQPGEWLLVEMAPDSQGLIGIGHHPAYLSIGTDAVDVTKVYDMHGKQLDV